MYLVTECFSVSILGNNGCLRTGLQCRFLLTFIWTYFDWFHNHKFPACYSRDHWDFLLCFVFHNSFRFVVPFFSPFNFLNTIFISPSVFPLCPKRGVLRVIPKRSRLGVPMSQLEVLMLMSVVLVVVVEPCERHRRFTRSRRQTAALWRPLRLPCVRLSEQGRSRLQTGVQELCS